MAFYPGKPAHLTGPQYQLVQQICQDLATWQSSVPHKMRDLQSPNELKLYRAIREWHPHKMVLAQVQLIRLVNVNCDEIATAWKEQGSDPRCWIDFGGLIGDINLLSLDFVIFNPSGTSGLVIELDGDEHSFDEKVVEDWVVKSSLVPNWNGSSLIKTPKRVEGWYRDRIKEHAVKSAGFHFIRFLNRDLNNHEAMQGLQLAIARLVL